MLLRGLNGEDGEFNRVQIFKMLEQNCLHVAAKALPDVRARAGENDLAVPARQKETNRY